MTNEKILRKLENFDPELCGQIRSALKQQRTTLSLIPTTNAASPFASFLKGSTLGDEIIDHHKAHRQSRLEKLAISRAKELFNAEHAIVRTGSLAIASRVVMLALLKKGDTVLSFNLRKSEYCTGDLQYNFVKFGVEPDTLELNFAKVQALAHKHRPDMIIYSPVNYPRNIDYAGLRKIADEVGAYLWIDLGQNSGLIAAGKIPSPVPYADVATFAASDALHGPQNGIILCKEKIAELLDKTVIETGHSSLKKNVLASLALVFKEADCMEYQDYAQQVLDNARGLENGLLSAGCKLLCSPTENHLVLVQLPEGTNGSVVAEKLKTAGLMVKAEQLLTAEDTINYSILRLSSLDSATRYLQPEEMEEVGRVLGQFLNSPQDDVAMQVVNKFIKKLVEDLPLFAEDWLPEMEAFDDGDAEMSIRAMIHWNI
ncbi:MAG: serine hydroxymethyltransferase [Selenomonas ruminantium]|jgi:glycine hydroxymethyltransferase|uniref:Serine hydroxymethyltransferase n=1 Tax=Selenomonas ruminantium TaxID=971 RepID=A0A927WF61_SELRU|nr:serine hydroxymethyltransferase [Selenomonas ruminantium]MBE6085583.1 serine hydroxymethyltransferase [Selenomonas ruminantium]